MQNAIERLKSAAGKRSAETILAAVAALGTPATVEERMVRAALIDAYAEKTSPAEADALMDALGL